MREIDRLKLLEQRIARLQAQLRDALDLREDEPIPEHDETDRVDGHSATKRTYHDQLRGLAQASVSIAAASTLEAVLQETTDQAREIIGAHLAATHLVRDLHWATARVVVSLSDKYQRFRSFDTAPIGAGIYAQAIRGERPLRLNNAELQDHPAWRSFGQYASEHPPLLGLLAVPLFGRDRSSLGVLMVSDKTRGVFTAEDKAILVQLAQLASVIIERTEAKQALRNSEEHLRATYEHASVGIMEADAQGRILQVNKAFCTVSGCSKEELVGRTFFDLTHPEDVEPDQASYEKQVAGEIGTYSIEKRYFRCDGEIAWVQVSSSAVRDESGRFQYSVRVVQDITERKRAEERQLLLMSELDHRVKNTLARVQSIAAQTLHTAASPEAFYDGFEARLQALSSAHNLLTEAAWGGASLRSLIERELAPYQNGTERRCALDGPDIVLSSRATLSLSMVFHELTTNAAKYGALSVPDGRVEVRWWVSTETGDVPALQMDWRELDGPAVTHPRALGFGFRLIQMSIVHELGGEVQLGFESGGLHCTMKQLQVAA